jgi:hypothetical protein
VQTGWGIQRVPWRLTATTIYLSLMMRNSHLERATSPWRPGFTRSAFGADGGCYLMGHSNGPGSTNKWIMWLGSDKVSFVSTEIGWKTVGNYDFAIDDWNHVGLRLQEDTLTAFVDGLPIGSTSVPESFSIPDASRPLTIGTCEFDRPHRYLQGSLDELRFYDRALSNSEMQALVPEPSTFAIGTLFLSGLALRRRSH